MQMTRCFLLSFLVFKSVVVFFSVLLLLEALWNITFNIFNGLAMLLFVLMVGSPLLLLLLLNARLVKCFCPVTAGQIWNRSYAMYDLPLPTHHLHLNSPSNGIIVVHLLLTYLARFQRDKMSYSCYLSFQASYIIRIKTLTCSTLRLAAIWRISLFWQVISKTDDRILRNLSKLEKPDWLGKTTFEIYFLGQIVNQILYERKAKRMS